MRTRLGLESVTPSDNPTCVSTDCAKLGRTHLGCLIYGKELFPLNHVSSITKHLKASKYRLSQAPAVGRLGNSCFNHYTPMTSKHHRASHRTLQCVIKSTNGTDLGFLEPNLPGLVSKPRGFEGSVPCTFTRLYLISKGNHPTKSGFRS